MEKIGKHAERQGGRREREIGGEKMRTRIREREDRWETKGRERETKRKKE